MCHDILGSHQVNIEILPHGITLNQCGHNAVCYNDTACCTNGDPIYYVDPDTRNIQIASQANVGFGSPTWWDPAVSKPSTRRLFTSYSAISTTLAHDTALSTGALAGIGVGCATAGIALAALAWRLLFRRKRRGWAQK